MKKRATDKPVFHARYNEDGKIVALYNTFTHSTIPEPTVVITEFMRNKIVKSPGAYRVDVDAGTVVQTRKTSVKTASVDDTVREAIGKGVEHNGHYFCADSESSAYMTQCLMLSLSGESSSFALPAYKNGVADMIEVDADELSAIVSKVNVVRAAYMKARLPGAKV